MRKIFEKFRVDSSWLLDQKLTKHPCYFQTHFTNTISKHFSKSNFQNIEISFQKDTHLCIHSNKNYYKGFLDKGLFSKYFQKPHHKHTIKTKDHSPSMTLSELPKQNDQVPQENCQKYLTQLLSWFIRRPAPVPFNILTQGCSPNTMVKQHC